MVLGECSGWLAGLGYSPGSAAGVVNVLERLSWWMQLVGSGVEDIDEDLLARFLCDGGGVLGMVGQGPAEHGADRGESGVAGSAAVATLLFEVVVTTTLG